MAAAASVHSLSLIRSLHSASGFTGVQSLSDAELPNLSLGSLHLSNLIKTLQQALVLLRLAGICVIDPAVGLVYAARSRKMSSTTARCRDDDIKPMELSDRQNVDCCQATWRAG